MTNPLDNLKSQTSSDLKKQFEEAQKQEENDTKSKETIPAKPVSQTPAPAKEPPKETLILGKFKTTEDVVKAYQEAERKITELSTKKVEPTPAPVAQPAADPLWASLFGDNSQVQTNRKQVNEDPDDEVTALKKRLDTVEKAGYISLLQNQAAIEKINAEKMLANDPDLPFDANVELEIEERIFKQYPQLKYSKGGYITAHQLLKGEKASEIAAKRSENAVKEALEKASKNSSAIVETPSKGDPEPQVDPTNLSMKDLRSYLNKDLGTFER